MDIPAAPVVEPVAPVVEAPSEDQEWTSALEEFAPGLSTDKTNDKKEENESIKPTEDVETTEAPKAPENETPEEKALREEKEAADLTDAGKEEEEPDTSIRDARTVAREAAKEVDAVKSDVRSKMFSDIPTTLQDASGDPIRTVEDVMLLVNPLTNEPFTQEEAATWLLSAQQKFNQNIADMEKRIDEIADVNVELKDQADSVLYKYGELLKAMPELRDEIWTEYEKTLEKDPKTNIITKAPVSMERFYQIALRPYVTLAESLEAKEAAQTAAEKTAEEAKRALTRADRSDIYGAGKDTNMDAEDKEWAEAGKAYFGK